MENEFATIVEKINEALGPQAEMLMQQYISSNIWVAIIWGCILAVALCFIVWGIIIRDDQSEELLVIGGCFCALVVVASMLAVANSILNVKYPELNLLRSLLSK